MPSKDAIFISYRRSDSSDASGRINDYLLKTYTNKQVFYDISDLRPGGDYSKEIQKHLENSSVCLVIIGKGWLEARNNSGIQRLIQTKDMVHFEIKMAFDLGLKIIPVLINGARMPEEDELPTSIHDLHYITAAKIRNEHFETDMEDLLEVLKKNISPRFKIKKLLFPVLLAIFLSLSIGVTINTYKRYTAPITGKEYKEVRDISNESDYARASEFLLACIFYGSTFNKERWENIISKSKLWTENDRKKMLKLTELETKNYLQPTRGTNLIFLEEAAKKYCK